MSAASHLRVQDENEHTKSLPRIPLRFIRATVLKLANFWSLWRQFVGALAHRFFAPALWCAERTLLILEIMEIQGLESRARFRELNLAT